MLASYIVQTFKTVKLLEYFLKFQIGRSLFPMPGHLMDARHFLENAVHQK